LATALTQKGSPGSEPPSLAVGEFKARTASTASLPEYRPAENVPIRMSLERADVRQDFVKREMGNIRS